MILLLQFFPDSAIFTLFWKEEKASFPPKSEQTHWQTRAYLHSRSTNDHRDISSSPFLPIIPFLPVVANEQTLVPLSLRQRGHYHYYTMQLYLKDNSNV